MTAADLSPLAEPPPPAPPVVLCYRDGVVRDDVPFEAVDGQVAEPGTVIWLDLERPDDAELDRLREELRIHPLAIEDIRTPHQRPKVDEYERSTLVVLFAIQFGRRSRLVLTQVAIFVGPGYIVTVRQAPVPAIDALRERWRQNPSLVEPHPIGFLLYRLGAALVETYFPLVDILDARVEDVEEQLFDGFAPRQLQHIITLRRNLVELRRVITPMRDVFTNLARHEDLVIGNVLAPYFTDLVDLVLRVTDTIDTLRDRLATALETYLTLQSNELNNTMKRLTALTVVLMVPTLVAGVYGMNFDAMPELHWPLGYPFALVLMAASAGAALWLFRRSDWI